MNINLKPLQFTPLKHWNWVTKMLIKWSRGTLSNKHQQMNTC